MIANQNPVFKAHASKYLQPMVNDFKNQVMFIESSMIESGFNPTSFHLGRNDTHQFFEFGTDKTDETLVSELTKKLKSYINPSNTPLIYDWFCYKCDLCSRIHVCCYLKALSPKNPFRIADLQGYLKYFPEEEKVVN